MKKIAILSLFFAFYLFGEQYDWQVRNSMKTNLEQLNKYCPIESHPEDLDRCKSVVKNIRKAVDNVETQNQKIAEFIKASEYLVKAEKKIPEWENKNKQDAEAKKEASKLSDSFRNLVREHGVIGSLWGMKTDPKKYIQENADILLKDVEKAKKMETVFLEDCKAGKYDNVSTFSKEGSSDHPKSVCDVAQNWKTYFKSYAERVLLYVLNKHKSAITAHLKNLEEKGELYEFDIPRLEKPKEVVDSLVLTYSPLAKELGIELTADYFKDIIELAKPYSQILKKTSTKNRWDAKAKFQDKSVSAAFKKAVYDNGMSVSKIGLTHSDWTIYKNSYGIPTHKIRSGYVLSKAKNEKFCRLYYFTARSEFEGGKKGYTLPRFSFEKKSTGFTISSCK
ncbi:hypothetical protein JXR93_06025 [bacterium]|nr:hypothetical protein [bacterium]